MADLDVNAFLNTSMKEDPLVDPEEGPSGGSEDTKAAAAVVDPFGPPLQNHEIGPEDGRIHIRFPVVKLQYLGQRFSNVQSHNSWHVRADTRLEMWANLWKLARPHLKRAIEFPRANDPCWSEKELPDQSDLPLFLVFRCNSGKRSYRLDQIDDERWRKWTTQSNLLLIVYQHSHQIHSKAAWELAVDKLLTPGAALKKPILVGEELKLDTMLKRLRRLNHDKLIPKKEDAYEQWARWILKAPSRRHSTLSSSMPPGELLRNFVVVKQTNGGGKRAKRSAEPVQRRNRYISGPAQREHTTDGFGFEDEVKVLRQTVTQIRDLVDMLDHRVGLLEEKCQGFRQTVQGNGQPPKKRVKKVEEDRGGQDKGDGEDIGESEDSDEDDEGENGAGFDDEPMVNEDGGDSDGGGDEEWVNPDPLLFNDLVDVKEESPGRDD